MSSNFAFALFLVLRLFQQRSVGGKITHTGQVTLQITITKEWQIDPTKLAIILRPSYTRIVEDYVLSSNSFNGPVKEIFLQPGEILVIRIATLDIRVWNICFQELNTQHYIVLSFLFHEDYFHVEIIEPRYPEDNDFDQFFTL